jgi:hypothetical protein
LSVYTGQSLVVRQLSPLYWQVMDSGQSVFWLQLVLLWSEHVPPLVEGGQFAAVVQVTLLFEEQVPIGLVQAG